MFAIDTNILVYAHNKDAPLHHAAVTFIENSLNDRDKAGVIQVCLSSQVLMEFINVITRHELPRPLSLPEASGVVQDYLDTGITVVSQRATQVRTFLHLISLVRSRRNIFDLALAATLLDNGVNGLFTVNVDDFKNIASLRVVNPL